MQIKTKSGTWTIPDGIHSDFRFVKAWRDMRSADRDKSFAASIDLVSAVFCDEAEELRFLESLTDETGRVPIREVYAALNELLEAAAEADKDTKNS